MTIPISFIPDCVREACSGPAAKAPNMLKVVNFLSAASTRLMVLQAVFDEHDAYQLGYAIASIQLVLTELGV